MGKADIPWASNDTAHDFLHVDYADFPWVGNVAFVVVDGEYAVVVGKIHAVGFDMDRGPVAGL